jgi:acyl-CoA synthetase (AMP-forming)/AMP-acid ligase II
MAIYKVPEVLIIDEFPLTDTGKVRKEVLRKQHASLFSGPEVS